MHQDIAQNASPPGVMQRQLETNHDIGGVTVIAETKAEAVAEAISYIEHLNTYSLDIIVEEEY